MRLRYILLVLALLSSLGGMNYLNLTISWETQKQGADKRGGPHDFLRLLFQSVGDERLVVMVEETTNARSLEGAPQQAVAGPIKAGSQSLKSSEESKLEESLEGEAQKPNTVTDPAALGLRGEEQAAENLEPSEWHRLPVVDPGVPMESPSGGLPPWLDSRTGPLFRAVEAYNARQPLNVDRFPLPPKKAGEPPPVLLVLYVHNRPAFLQVTVDALSRVEGINETTLIVSHDGYFPEVHAIIQNIKFCRVKQIYSPFSPHLHPGRFPGLSPNDCTEHQEPGAPTAAMLRGEAACVGDPDPFGNFRSTRIVSLKHHWWWLMNTVWKGRIAESRDHTGYISFFEEDHYLHPNAYRTLQELIRLRETKCPECEAVQLAPYRHDAVNEGSLGERILVKDAMGNLGYTFNSTLWAAILSKRVEFCTFNDYNWDWSLRTSVFPTRPGGFVASLRGPWRSATHFGTCGLHMRAAGSTSCSSPGLNLDVPGMQDHDKRVNVDETWGVSERVLKIPVVTGFGGWSDRRDQLLCTHIGSLGVESVGSAS